MIDAIRDLIAILLALLGNLLAELAHWFIHMGMNVMSNCEAKKKLLGSCVVCSMLDGEE